MSTREAPAQLPPEPQQQAPTLAPSPLGNGRASSRLASPLLGHEPVVVRRVLRHVDLWSVFRLVALLYVSFFAVSVVAGIGLWLTASATGARHSVEHFIASTLLVKNFRFDSVRILLSSLAIGVVFLVVATFLTVVLAAFFNLISDVVGGLEVTVIEEERV